METLRLENLCELSQIEVQEMDGGMYMLPDKASYDAQLRANDMIISFVAGAIMGFFGY